MYKSISHPDLLAITYDGRFFFVCVYDGVCQNSSSARLTGSVKTALLSQICDDRMYWGKMLCQYYLHVPMSVQKLG